MLNSCKFEIFTCFMSVICLPFTILLHLHVNRITHELKIALTGKRHNLTTIIPSLSWNFSNYEGLDNSIRFEWLTKFKCQHHVIDWYLWGSIIFLAGKYKACIFNCLIFNISVTLVVSKDKHAFNFNCNDLTVF